MISFTNIVDIDRTAADVYAYLSDLEHTPDWNWAITKTRKTTPGPIQVGTRYRQTRTVPGPATEDLEITTLEPDSHIGIKGTLAHFSARLDYHLDQRDGYTELTNSVTLETNGALALAAPVLGPRIKKAVDNNLAVLKTRLESPSQRPVSR